VNYVTCNSHAGPGPAWHAHRLTGRAARSISYGGTGPSERLDATTGAVILVAPTSPKRWASKAPDWGFIHARPLVVGDGCSSRWAGCSPPTIAPRAIRAGTVPRTEGATARRRDYLAGVTIRCADWCEHRGPPASRRRRGVPLSYSWKGADRIIPAGVIGDGQLCSAAAGSSRPCPRRGHAWQMRWLRVEERWRSEGLQPSFNDTVIHKGHAYGFVGPRLACIDLEDGARKWRTATMPVSAPPWRIRTCY